MILRDNKAMPFVGRHYVKKAHHFAVLINLGSRYLAIDNFAEYALFHFYLISINSSLSFSASSSAIVFWYILNKAPGFITLVLPIFSSLFMWVWPVKT